MIRGHDAESRERTRVLIMATIGFIGLGNMGAPMAANLVKAGHRVAGYDTNPAARAALAAAGGTAAASAWRDE